MFKDYDVFLSHNSVDKDIVRQIAAELKKRDYRCWFDEDNITGRIRSEIEAGLQGSAFFAYIAGLTPGRYQEKELDWWDTLGDQPQFAILLPGSDPNKLPLCLRSQKYVDMRAGVEHQFDKLCKRLEGARTSRAAYTEDWPKVARRVNAELKQLLASKTDRLGPTIDLTGSFPRTVEQRLQTWWSSGTPTNLVLLGEEGMGKTWAIARWIQETDFEVPVVWVSGRDVNSGDLSNLIASKIMAADSREDAWLKRLEEQGHRVLLILDGLNRIESSRAEHLLSTASAEPSLRTLVSCRPSEWAAFSWTDFEECPVGELDTEELGRALATMELGLQDIPDPLSGLLSIPLYFKVAVRLRDQFGSLDRISKDALVYQVYQQRLLDDPQLRQILGCDENGDLLGLLKDLAEQQLSRSGTVTKGAGRKEIIGVLEAYTKESQAALKELRSLKVLQSSLTGFRLEHHSLVQGLGLFLVSAMERQSFADAKIAQNWLKLFLEPNAETDLSTEILGAAFYFCSRLDVSNVVSRAILLEWVRSQNFDQATQNFRSQLFLNPEIYLWLCDQLWLDLAADRSVKSLLVEALAEWVVDLAEWPPYLKERIAVWLVLCKTPKYGHYAEFKPRGGLNFEVFCSENHLQVAETVDQTNLFFVALLLLSVRPQSGFVEPLVRGWVAGSIIGRHPDSVVRWLLQARMSEQFASEVIDLEGRLTGELLRSCKELKSLWQWPDKLLGNVSIRGRTFCVTGEDKGIPALLADLPEAKKRILHLLRQVVVNPAWTSLPDTMDSELFRGLEAFWLPVNSQNRLWLERSTTEASAFYKDCAPYLLACQPKLWSRLVGSQLVAWSSMPNETCERLGSYGALIDEPLLDALCSGFEASCGVLNCSSVNNRMLLQDLAGLLVVALPPERRLWVLETLPLMTLYFPLWSTLNLVDSAELEDAIIAKLETAQPEVVEKWMALLVGLHQIRPQEIRTIAEHYLNQGISVGKCLALLARLGASAENVLTAIKNGDSESEHWVSELALNLKGAPSELPEVLAEPLPVDIQGYYLAPDPSSPMLDRYRKRLQAALRQLSVRHNDAVASFNLELPETRPRSFGAFGTPGEGPTHRNLNPFSGWAGSDDLAGFSPLFGDIQAKLLRESEILNHILDGERRDGNQLFSDFTHPAALQTLAKLDLAFLLEICDQALRSPSRLLRKGRSFYYVLLLTLLDYDVPRGLKLLDSLQKHQALMEFLDQHNAPLHLVSIFAVGSGMEKLEYRRKVLAQANDDWQLMQIVKCARLGDWSWLKCWAVEGLKEPDPIVRAKSCRILGWSPSRDQVSLHLRDCLQNDRSKWVRGVAHSALSELDRESWARQWYERAKFSLDDIEATAAAHLFLKTADERCLLWTPYQDIDELEPGRRPLFSWLWYEFRRYRSNGESRLKGVFLGHEVASLRGHAWPWLG